MLENAQLIHRLSVEERINLILNKTVLSTSTVGDYDFPTITLNENPILKDLKNTATVFPSNQALALTWNEELVTLVNNKRGVESSSIVENSLYKQDGNIFGRKSVSEDPFLTGKILGAQTKGLHEGGAYASLDLESEEIDARKRYEVRLLPLQLALKANEYDMVIVDTVDDLRYWREEYQHRGLFFARAKNELDIIRFFNAGATLISYEGDYDHAVEYIKEALRRYKNEKAKLDNKMIFENEYLEMLTDGKILSLENLNLACDRLISLMVSLNDRFEKLNVNNKVYKKLFDRRENSAIEVVGHKEAAYKGAVESIVLLKNEGVLPLTINEKCAFFGDAFKNVEYYEKTFGIHPVEFVSPIDTASEYYEIDCEAFAHGYLKGQETRQELIDAAVELANKVKVAVVYLYGEGDEYLPKEQLEVLKAIAETGVRVVAVVHTPCMVDLSFVDMCAAVLYVGEVGQEGPKAVLDVLTGVANPSGKLTHSYPLLVADEHDTKGLPMYYETNERILYPFGFGLSYTTFDYHNLEITETGISLSVTNTGEYAGLDVVQLYIQKQDSKTVFKNRVLRGFKKVYVEKGETIKITIPFDEFTFRYYDVEKKGYGVEGGEYQIYVSDNCQTTKLEGMIKLFSYIDERVAFESRKDKMLSNKELKEFVQNKPLIQSYKFKLVMTILLALYITIFGGILVATNFIQEESNFGGIVLALLVGVLDFLLVTKAIKIVKIHQKEVLEHTNNNDENETLTLLVGEMEEIVANDRIVYEIEELVPVESDEDLTELEQIEEVEETTEEVEEVEEVEEKVEEVEEVEEEIVDLESTELTVEEIALHEEEEIKLMEEQQAHLNAEEGFKTYEKVVEFDTESSLSQAVSNFMEYAEYKGITIDINSVRSLLSGLGSSNILILNTRIKELIPAFVEILNDYLGNTSHIVSACDTWMSSFNLTWKKEEDGTYSKTDFVNDVYNANIQKNNIGVAILDNVNMQNVLNYLKEFVDFANYPSYSHSMRLNQKLVLKIPHNFKLILIPQNDDYLNEIPEELAEASISIELLMRKAEHVVEEEVKPNSLSYGYLEDLIYEAKKTDYIAEDLWKKLDDSLIELGLTELHNKVILQMEKYTSVYISAGGEDVDAFDSVIAEKVLPILKVLPQFKTYEGMKSLLTVIEKHLGHDNINRISRVLNIAVKE